MGGIAWADRRSSQYYVSVPTRGQEVVDHIRKETKARDFSLRPIAHDLQARVIHDPFRGLPVETSQHICSYLPGDSIKALMRALLAISVATMDDSFWRKSILKWNMPWFWAVNEPVEGKQIPSWVNWKRLYLWLDMISTPKYGKTDAFIGVANRRRIYTIGKQIAPVYFKSLDENSPQAACDATGIPLEDIKTGDMAFIAYPQPREDSTPVKSQFVYSQRKMSHQYSMVEVFWNNDDEMVGMAVTFGLEGQRRLFGRSDNDPAPGEQICRKAARIGENDWIVRIDVHVRTNQVLDLDCPRAFLFGVTVGSQSRTG